MKEGGKEDDWREGGGVGERKSPLNVSSTISVCLLYNIDNMGRISTIELTLKTVRVQAYVHSQLQDSSWHTTHLHSSH